MPKKKRATARIERNKRKKKLREHLVATGAVRPTKREVKQLAASFVKKIFADGQRESGHDSDESDMGSGVSDGAPER
jgi:hypothetical protein